jgi:L-fuconolactonase
MCKISGLVTEARWDSWRAEDFDAYLDIVAEAFGPERLMFGSDWPVCSLAASYDAVFEIVNAWLSRKGLDGARVFGANCASFYKVK